MRKLMYFVFSLAIVSGASFFASKFPDGLDFTAEKLGFAKHAVERSAFLGGYSFPLLKESPVSTIAAGAVGLFICYGAFWAANRLFNRKA